MTKTQIVLTGLAASCLVLAGACFSPWQESETGMVISLNGASARAADGLTYTVKLDGPGGPETRELNGGTTTMHVVPGNWDIRVDAQDGATKKLTQKGGADGVLVKAGKTTVVKIEMLPVTLVGTWSELHDTIAELNRAIQASQTVIVLPADLIQADTNNGSIAIGGGTAPSVKITITAESPDADESPKITRAPSFLRELFTVSTNGELTLSNIVLDGTDSGNGSNPLINVTSGGILNLEKGAVLQNNKRSSGDGGAVTVSGGTLTLSANAKISGNEAANGGGIYIKDSTFIMKGDSEVSGNSATNGGGIYITSGSTFKLEGGRVSKNAASLILAGTVKGGGIYTESTGTIGAIEISENVASVDFNFPLLGYAYGGGVYTATAQTFEGTIIKNNIVSAFALGDIDGGGVYTAADASTFNSVKWDGNKKQTLGQR